MDRLDPRVLKRIGGPTWEKVRPQINRMNEALLGVSPSAVGELTTVYVKYTAPPQDQPFAVLLLANAGVDAPAITGEPGDGRRADARGGPADEHRSWGHGRSLVARVESLLADARQGRGLASQHDN